MLFLRAICKNILVKKRPRRSSSSLALLHREKTALAINLARKFSGEIISADSRQVYKDMDIGTGKATKKEQRLAPHHLLNVVSPKKQFTVVDFQKHAARAIKTITKRGCLPFLVGGTGQYIDAALYRTPFPDVKPNKQFRKQLQKKTVTELYRMLKKLDPKRASAIDRSNPRRLIRALEILRQTKKPVPKLTDKKSPYAILWLGIKLPKNVLQKNIHKRLKNRLRAGMIAEVKRLRNAGVSATRLESFGLEYRYVNRYLEGKLTKTKMTEELERVIRRYAKRQVTWFRRNSAVQWVQKEKEAEGLVKKFLSSQP